MVGAMRKTSLIFLGALVAVVATLLLTQPRTLLMGSAARAAASDTYRKLNLFGDVFERARARSPRCNAAQTLRVCGKRLEPISKLLAGCDPL